MTIFYVVSPPQEAVADRTRGIRSPSGGWLRAIAAACLAWAMPSRSELDELGEEQLQDAGFSRVTRRERWLDGRETGLPCDHGYRARPAD